MKIIAISDLHGFLPEIPPCDLLLIAGDICPTSNHRVPFQAEWLNTVFRVWLESLRQVGKVIGIAGNHDFIFQNAAHLVPPDLNWIYLEDSLTEYRGLRIWGTPWQPWFHDWAFNFLPGPAGEDQATRKWTQIPNDTAILVTHGPPQHILDETIRGRHVGCPQLLHRIHQLKALKLHVFGHIHESYGTHIEDGVLHVNACTCDHRALTNMIRRVCPWDTRCKYRPARLLGHWPSRTPSVGN